MPVPWLDPMDAPVFPCTSRALADPNGLLAAGGSLDADWLLAAYREGIFPWYEEGQPVLWWAPDPRLVLDPGRVAVSRSLRKLIRKQIYRISFDTAFTSVIEACQTSGGRENATWITPEMKAAYVNLHRLGHAHSVEVWRDEFLVGGLYGIALGKAFFGESMFSLVPNASKIAFWALSASRRRLSGGYRSSRKANGPKEGRIPDSRTHFRTRCRYARASFERMGLPW